jgi:hypothetical protein
MDFPKLEQAFVVLKQDSGDSDAPITVQQFVDSDLGFSLEECQVLEAHLATLDPQEFEDAVLGAGYCNIADPILESFYDNYARLEW